MKLDISIDDSCYLIWFHSISICDFISYLNFKTKLHWIILTDTLLHYLNCSISSWLLSLFL